MALLALFITISLLLPSLTLELEYEFDWKLNHSDDASCQGTDIVKKALE